MTKASKNAKTRLADSGSSRQSETLDDRLLATVLDWIGRLEQAESELLEAELDRASFESFPASDPVAPAVASSRRRSALRIDCEIADDRLVFSRALRTDDAASVATRGEPDEVIEGESHSGVQISLALSHADRTPDNSTPQPIELPAEHASLRPKQSKHGDGSRSAQRLQQGAKQSRNDKRSGEERRIATMPPPSQERRSGQERRSMVV